MRERKYKFWDKHNKVWVGPYTLKQLADEDAFSSDREWKPICSEWEWFECVDYTGRKDKKGIEIYESDLVMRDNNTAPHVIEWDDGSYCTRNVMSKTAIDGIDNEHVEVIGNIYEHPELLEQGT